MSAWHDRWTREPATRRAAWWSLGASLLVIALFGWQILARGTGAPWVDALFGVAILANLAFAWSAIRRLRRP
jgi:hypothetical protein